MERRGQQLVAGSYLLLAAYIGLIAAVALREGRETCCGEACCDAG